jgi:hypothetical protein
MNVFDAIELLERASVPEPPGCHWMNWELLGHDFVRPIQGFTGADGRVCLDAAIVGLFELSNAGGFDAQLKLIRDAEDLACRRVVSFSVAEARPLG